MKKFFLILASLWTCTLFAQEEQVVEKSTELGINVGYDFSIDEGASGGVFNFMPEYGKYFSDHFYLGAGTGFSTSKFETFSIPLFLRAEVDFATKRVIPYVSLLAGYDFNVDGGDGFIRLNPTLGVKVPVSANTLFNVGFNYTRTIVDGGGSNMLGFKAGLCFNSGALSNAGKSIGRFFRDFNASAEIEYIAPTAGYSCAYGLRLNFIHDFFLQNLGLGLSLGVGKQDKELEAEIPYYLSIMARMQYRATQLKFGNMLYPFVYVDAGIAPYNGDGDYFHELFFLSPNVGLCLDINEKHSVDIAVGYTKQDDSGTLRLAIGYDF